MESVDLPIVVKCMLIGDTNTGKSQIVNRFNRDTFHDTYIPTVGIDYHASRITLENGKTARVANYDTSGQERFRLLSLTYYPVSHLVFLVYDCTNKESFDNMTMWVEDCEANANEGTLKYLLCNKVDLVSSRVISEKEGREFAQKHGMMYSEVSAKTGQNIKKAFEQATEACVQKQNQNPVSEESKLNESISHKEQRLNDALSNENTHAEKSGAQGSLKHEETKGENSVIEELKKQIEALNLRVKSLESERKSKTCRIF